MLFWLGFYFVFCVLNHLIRGVTSDVVLLYGEEKQVWEKDGGCKIIEMERVAVNYKMYK